MSGLKYIAVVQNMSASEMLEHVPPEKFAEIKRLGGKIEAYRIAHPGKSKTHIVGFGQKILKWSRSAIEALKEKLGKIKAFYLHNEDNSLKGRRPIGEIIKNVLTPDGSLVAIIHKFKEFKDYVTNVASFEGTLNLSGEFAEGQEHDVQPSEVEGISAIALGNGDTEKPAFENAVLIESIQCFQKKEIQQMTKEEIIQAVQEMKLTPGQIFSDEEILGHPAVKDEVRAHKGNENQENKIGRLEAKVERLKGEHEQKVKELEDTIKEHKQKSINYLVKEKYDQVIGGRDKLTDTQKAYLNRRKDSINIPGDIDEKNVDGEINSWMDKSLGDFEADQEIFTGKSNGEANVNGTGNEKDNHMPAGSNETGSDIHPTDIGIPGFHQVGPSASAS